MEKIYRVHTENQLKKLLKELKDDGYVWGSNGDLCNFNSSTFKACVKEIETFKKIYICVDKRVMWSDECPFEFRTVKRKDGIYNCFRDDYKD